MLLTTILFVSGILIGVAFAFSIPVLQVSENFTRDSKLDQLDNWLQRLYTQGKFHGVVLVSLDGDVVFEKGYGFADINEKEELTTHSSFNLASVSKQFTAAGIILLKSRGKLSYSDELQKYIPELSFYNGVTVRHLLNHTSGIPDYLYIANKYIDEPEIITIDKLLSIYSEQQPKQEFNPGDKFKYNNMGYVLLAEIIARVSGQSFATYMDDNIFVPLGMKDTQVFNLLSGVEPKNRVFGFKKKYYLFGKKQLSDLNRFDGVAGDGSIYSSAYDLYIWHKALLSGALIPTEDVSEAYKSNSLNNGNKTGYGFGWFINDNGAVEHAGGWQGFATYLFRDISKNQLIVILDNTGNIFRVTSNGVRYNSIPLNLRYFVTGF